MSPTRRKMFNLDPRLLLALEFFARDRRLPLDDLLDEALRDLLKKHKRPLTLKDALQESTRGVPANDPGPAVPPQPKAKSSSRPRRPRSGST